MNKFKSILIGSIIFGLVITVLSLYSIHNAFAQTPPLMSSDYSFIPDYSWLGQTYADDQKLYQEIMIYMQKFGSYKAAIFMEEFLNWLKYYKDRFPRPMPIPRVLIEKLLNIENVNIVPCFSIPSSIWAVIPSGMYAVYIDGVFVGYVWVT